MCSGNKYQGTEPLEKQEEILAKAMIELYKNQELRQKYKNQKYTLPQLNFAERSERY